MRLAIINDYQCLAIETASWNRLPDNVKVDVYNDQLTDAEEAALRLAPYDIVVTAREETTFNRTLVEALPNLKLLVFHGARNSALDLTALSDKGVTVCGTGYGFTNGTVELTWGLILSLVKHLPQEDLEIRSGGWGAGLPLGLTGKTLGVLGLGTLGSGVSRVGLALDMDVIAWSENLTHDRCSEIGVRLVTKNKLFEVSDVLSIHLTLSDRTRGLVSAEELSLMKRGAYLINTSRGPIVDEAALITALEENRIATSHIGGRTYENLAARYQDCLEDGLAWLDGSPIRVVERN